MLFPHVNNELPAFFLRAYLEALAANPHFHTLDLTGRVLRDGEYGLIQSLLEANPAIHTLSLRYDELINLSRLIPVLQTNTSVARLVFHRMDRVSVARAVALAGRRLYTDHGEESERRAVEDQLEVFVDNVRGNTALVSVSVFGGNKLRAMGGGENSAAVHELWSFPCVDAFVARNIALPDREGGLSPAT